MRLASVDIPLPVSTAMTGALLGTLILIFTIIKLLTILGDEATIWAWVGVALAVVIAVGAFMTVQEAGGVDTLKSEASSYGGSGSTAAAAPAAPAATAPPAAAEPLRRPSPSTPPAHEPRRECSGRGRGGLGRDERRAVDRAGAARPAHRSARPRRAHAPRRRCRARARTACKSRISAKASTLWRVSTGLRQPDADHTPKGISMAKFKSLSRGTQIVLVAGPLLFLSLFLTWQNVAVDYGRAGIATLPLDGWDAWGLLLGLLVLSTLTLVVLTKLTEVEMSSDVPWAKVTLGLGAATFAVAVAQEPHRRRLVVGELRVRRARGGGRGRARTSTGPPRARSAQPLLARRSAAGSGQPLDEQRAVLARPVVVLGDPLDLEPERLVERERALVQRVRSRSARRCARSPAPPRRSARRAFGRALRRDPRA